MIVTRMCLKIAVWLAKWFIQIRNRPTVVINSESELCGLIKFSMLACMSGLTFLLKIHLTFTFCRNSSWPNVDEKDDDVRLGNVYEQCYKLTEFVLCLAKYSRYSGVTGAPRCVVWTYGCWWNVLPRHVLTLVATLTFYSGRRLVLLDWHF